MQLAESMGLEKAPTTFSVYHRCETCSKTCNFVPAVATVLAALVASFYAAPSSLLKAFKIRRNGAATTNMMLFDQEGKVKKYALCSDHDIN